MGPPPMAGPYGYGHPADNLVTLMPVSEHGPLNLVIRMAKPNLVTATVMKKSARGRRSMLWVGLFGLEPCREGRASWL